MNTKRRAMARVASTGRASGGKRGLVVLLVATAAVLLITVALSPVAVAKTTKVDICHHKGSTATYALIRVAEPAVAALLAHGDAMPGQAVPTAPGYQFGPNCSLILVDTDLDGVADDIDNCPFISNPDQSNLYGSPKGDACEDTNGDGILDVNEADICVSVNGVIILEAGTAGCLTTFTTGAPNIAVANGAGAYAYGYGGNNSVGTAIGVDAYAEAFGNSGDNNIATAIGNGAQAFAWGGHDNTAIASGVDAEAEAIWGDNNSATATGDGTSASATATTGCTATATTANPTVTCS